MPCPATSNLTRLAEQNVAGLQACLERLREERARLELETVLHEIAAAPPVPVPLGPLGPVPSYTTAAPSRWRRHLPLVLALAAAVGLVAAGLLALAHLAR